MFLNTVESSNFMVFMVTFFKNLFCSPDNSCPLVLTLQKDLLFHCGKLEWKHYPP
jgi:hypothetical protein